jgi:hypothetical protein
MKLKENWQHWTPEQAKNFCVGVPKERATRPREGCKIEYSVDGNQNGVRLHVSWV